MNGQSEVAAPQRLMQILIALVMGGVAVGFFAINAAMWVMANLNNLKTLTLAGDPEAQIRARFTVEQVALMLQASLLVRYSAPYVADNFIASRLGNFHGYTYGTLLTGNRFDEIIGRYVP